MIFFRKRLFFWLIRAYIKRWGKRIFLFFLVGLIVFFVFLRFIQFVIPKIPFGQTQSIGIVGAYTIDNLPPEILHKVSQGLTIVSSDDKVIPALASSWKIQDNGKTYIFLLKPNIYLSDHEKLTSSDINYSFSDVSIQRPNKDTIVFKLKDSYSPFLLTVSRPIFKKGFIGVGDYRLKDIRLNGSFIQSLALSSVKNQYNIEYYHFYPSEEALKTAFALGEISSASGLTNLQFKNSSFDKFPNIKTNKYINYNRLVTLFYNTRDNNLSDEKLRSALSYTLPDSFFSGKRNYFSYSPSSWAYPQDLTEKTQDITHAKSIMSQSKSASGSSEITLTIKTLSKYMNTAKEIADSWKEIGVKTNIEIVDSVPSQFQIFLGDFRVPKDPDQYTLWHKDQENNITGYQNLRIDKLLEDGRKETDLEKRKKIYTDFQKYLLADSPASFVYFPYEYEITKK